MEELVDFSENNPWRPQFSNALIRRFVNELVSSRQMIFDLHDRFGRAAAAVLLDRVQNPSNDACLEILGVRSDVDIREVFSHVANWAGQNVPSNRLGFQISVPSDLSLTEDFFLTHRLVPFFQTFEMYCTDFSLVKEIVCPQIRHAVESDAESIFQLLCESFADNPETSVPEKVSWRNGFLKSPLSHFFLWEEHKEILGFVNIIFSDEQMGEAEIRTLGVAPKARGQNIGRNLLQFCLSLAKRNQTAVCHLSVAITNRRALNMYLNAGFVPKDKYICYRSQP